MIEPGRAVRERVKEKEMDKGTRAAKKTITTNDAQFTDGTIFIRCEHITSKSNGHY